MRISIALIPVLLGSSLLLAQATQPSDLEFRAREAFTRGQYVAALPLLQQLADTYKSTPDKLGSVQEEIRVCQKAIAAATANAQQSQAPVQSDPAMAAETRKPHPAPKPGETITLAIKELGNFEYDADKGGGIPTDVKALSGAKLKLNGFMIPMDQADHISQFALVPSLFACCFGQPPQIQHTIVVTCPKGKAVNYYPDEISVEGTLKVDEKKEDGFIVSIFELECSSVKPMAR